MLKDDVVDDTSGSFQKLLVLLCNVSMDSTTVVLKRGYEFNRVTAVDEYKSISTTYYVYAYTGCSANVRIKIPLHVYLSQNACVISSG